MHTMILSLGAAILLDIAIGEYPESIHPVVWIGKLISFWDKRFYGGFWHGFMLIPIFLVISSSFIFVDFLPILIAFPIKVYFLKSTFSIRTLYEFVHNTCRGGKMNRKEVQKIVSRNTENLDEEHLASAAIESCAENTVDSIISPLFFFAFFGLAGAFFFRCINTADAMIGYRTKRYEKFGKAIARTDDILNYIPARISFLLSVLISPRKVISHRKFTRGKNGMYPMAAFSAILGVKLEKIGHYTIPGRNPNARDVEKSIILSGILVSIWIAVVMGIAWWCETLGIWPY